MNDQRTIKFAFLPIFFLIAIGLTWPLAANLQSHLPAGSDSIVHYWNSWWVGQALSNGQSPYETNLFFAPNGLSLVYHNFAWIHILGSLVLAPIAGSAVAYNLILLINLALCGFFAAVLVHHLTRQQTVAFIAGLIYIAWPYRLTQPDHPNLHSSWPIPLFMLMLIRLLEKKRWQDGVWCGLAFALVGYMRWQMLIPATFIGTVYFIVWLMSHRRANQSDPAKPAATTYRSIVWPLITAVIIALVTLSPPILLLVQESQQNPAQLILDSEVESMQTDLLAYITPAPWHSMVGDWATALYDQYYPNRGSRSIYSPFIGYTTLILCVIALWQMPRQKTAPWLAIGLILILLALGPILLINGRRFDSIPTFYRLFDRLLIARLLREPDRFNMFLGLPVAVLAGYGVCALTQTERWVRNKNLWAGGLSLLVLVEYLVVPLPLQTIQTSLFYQSLPDNGGAVLDIPLDPFKSKPYMLAQITHGRPIAQGHASRYPAGAFGYLESNPWLNEMLLFDGQPPLHQDIGQQLDQLAADGFDYVVLHKNSIRPGYIEKWRRTIPVPPDFEDEQLLVFKTDYRDSINQSSLLTEPLPGFGPLMMTASATCQNPSGVLGLDVAWGRLSGAADVTTMQTQLRLSNDTSEWLSDSMPLTELALAEMADPTFFWGDYEWDLPADIPSGRHTFELVRQTNNAENMMAAITPPLEVVIQNEPCLYPAPETFTSTNSLFGDTARLLGYRLNQTADELELTLLWRPEQRTGVEYTVFVHLLDLDTGEIVAQSDAMPRNWQYPTSRWGLNEEIDEQITLQLAGVPSGNYGLGVGLYNGVTGDRLPILVANGAVPLEDLNGRLILQTVTIDRTE